MPWATAWVVWVAWGVWVQAWGQWVLATAPRVVTVTRQVTVSKLKQGRALVSRAWDRATANKPRVDMDHKGAGMVSKGPGVMEGKQAAGVLELGVTLVTGRTRLLQGKEAKSQCGIFESACAWSLLHIGYAGS